jgi:hypothetical protein
VLKKLTLALLLVAMTFSTAFAASYVDCDVQIILEGGVFQIEKDSNFGFDNVTIASIVAAGSTIAWPTAVPDFTVTDARGLTGGGSGWHVNFQCDQLENSNDPSYTLDLGYFKAETLLTEDEGQAPVAGEGPLHEAQNELNMNTELLVVNCAEGYGKGVYSMDYGTGAGTEYSIPLSAATARAGTYAGTFTATLFAGPGGTGSWTGNVQ